MLYEIVVIFATDFENSYFKDMKKFILKLALAVAALSCISACTYENVDTFVQWGFADDVNSDIFYGMEILLPSANQIFNAFDTEFAAEFGKYLNDHEAIMESQHSWDDASNLAKKIADRAHATLPAGLTCTVDRVFVVRIRYASERFETVWYHDYRH